MSGWSHQQDNSSGGALTRQRTWEARQGSRAGRPLKWGRPPLAGGGEENEEQGADYEQFHRRSQLRIARNRFAIHS